MHIGYARVSTGEQKLDLQLDALKEVGCQKIYQEQTSGAAKHRPELERCLEQLRGGDTLVVWRLDRFGRSLKDLVGKMEDARRERRRVQEPHRRHRYDDGAGALDLSHLWGAGGVRA